jgi:hypothetical protein
VRHAWGLALGLLVLGCASTVPTRRVTMDQMQQKIGQLTGLGELPLEKAKVTYLAPGKGAYDAFFKASAEMRGGVMLSEAFSEALTRNLRAFARSYAAQRAADENVREIVGSTPIDQLGEDQSFALLELKKKRGELHQDEAVYVVSSAANTSQMVIYLNRTSLEAQLLAEQGNTLRQSVVRDFGGREILRAPQVTRGLGDSMGHIREASLKASALARTLTRLGECLRGLM